MAKMLTTTYKEISRFELIYADVITYARYEKQDGISNETTYWLKSVYLIPSYIHNTYVSFDRATAVLDGETKTYGYTTFYKNASGTIIQEVKRTIKHNEDGSSKTKNIATSWNATFGGSGSTNVDIIFPKIDRIPTITNATNFNDESNPTINFSNPAGFTMKPFLKFYNTWDLNNVLLTINRNENVASPYTWNLTSSERDNIRKKLVNSNVYKVAEGFDVYNGNTKMYTIDQNKDFTFVNANPSVSLNFQELNQKVIDIYGNNKANTIIKNISQLKITSNVNLKKYATLKSRVYNANGRDYNSSEIGSLVPTSNYFRVNITDSRNYEASANKTITMVDYLPIAIKSFEFKRINPTERQIKLNANITYYQGTYNNKANTPTIQYKMGDNGALRTITSGQYTIDNYSHTLNIRDLTLVDQIDYTQSAKFYLYAKDIFTNTTDNEIVPKGIPTFEAGENDLQVNGQFYLADNNGNNKKTISQIADGIAKGYAGQPASFVKDYGNTSKLIKIGYEGAGLSDVNQFCGYTTNGGKTAIKDISKQNTANILLPLMMGSIFSSGSNSNGSWIKFGNGIMVCYGLRVFRNIDVRNAWGSLYESKQYSLGNFPQTFKEEPIVCASTGQGYAAFLEYVVNTTGSYIGDTYFVRPGASTGDFRINFIAIGKWK